MSLLSWLSFLFCFAFLQRHIEIPVYCVHCVSKHHSSSGVVMDTDIEVPSAENLGPLKVCCRLRHSSSKATKGTIKCCYVLHRVTWGLSSFMISSLQTSTHRPEMKINPPKMACGYPRGGVIENSHICACPVECTCQCTSARK